MDLDRAESVVDRDFDLEQRKLVELYGEYKAKYVRRIKSLDKLKGVFVEDNSFNGVKAGHHIMYKFICGEDGSTELRSRDGNRAYEFLVEFDLEDVEYGIYYGCRGLIKGGDQEEQIAILQSEWDDILCAEVCSVLNNTFVDKDFSGRFQKTNNANNRTYWPFWIALYEDEDVVEVAARAVGLIYRVYKRFLEGIIPEKRIIAPKELLVRTKYTEKAFEDAIRSLNQECKRFCLDGAKAKAVFKRFIRNSEKEGRLGKQGIVVDLRYEKCWRFNRMSNVQVGFLLAELTERMGVRKGKEPIPWRYFSGNFISAKDEPLENIRQSHSQSDRKSEEKHNLWAKQYLDRILL